MGIPGYNEGPFRYTEIHTNTTTTIKTQQGLLHSIAINAPGSAWNVAVTDGGAALATITPSTGQDSMIYDVGFVTNLVVTTTGTTPGSVTLSWI